MLEPSSACLCPSMAYQLEGAKKVHQDLAHCKPLFDFISSAHEVAIAPPDVLRPHVQGGN